MHKHCKSASASYHTHTSHMLLHEWVRVKNKTCVPVSRKLLYLMPVKMFSEQGIALRTNLLKYMLILRYYSVQLASLSKNYIKRVLVTRC